MSNDDNESKSKCKDHSTERVKLKGTMYKQSPLLFVLQDIYSSALVYSCGNINTKVLIDDDHNGSNNGKSLEEKEFEEFFRHKATPTLPLEIQPIKNSNKYEYSLFYNTFLDNYYRYPLNLPLNVKEDEQNFEGIELIHDNWNEGILSLHMKIDKNLK